ncbi:MAG: class B sortase [Provencibacterium sp.]|jgi:sortase B|nr:class B sortase [Provencibacterium sp.]
MYAKIKRAAALALAVAMVASLAACNKTPAPDEDVSSSGGFERWKPSSWTNPLSIPELESEYQVEVPEENRQQLQEQRESLNSDIVCWLQVPNTSINKPVVQTTDNDYYYRRGLDKQYLFDGTLWMDYECDLKDGTKSDVPQNTIIYGHNLGNPQGVTDDPTGVEFAQLLYFNDIEFARANPYVYLSTDNEDLVYQIFAVIYTEASMKPVSYIYPSYSNSDFAKLLEDIHARSIYNYPDVNVTISDKILTLSTCTYKYGPYSQNNQQRFVVFAKLVQGKNFAETANVEENPNPKQPTF